MTALIPLKFLITFVITLRSCWAILVPRGGSSDVACEGEFIWMENSQKLNPCYVAASAQAACRSNSAYVSSSDCLALNFISDWTVEKLNGTYFYDVRKSPDVCSW